ncbi:MFS transporter [Alkalihalobacillus sp. AL-G]|uniref:MFS transporter n=1 Tax=Alkalihalobacillus sp. AL-G TaxID=2926399 RepID=UPI00272C8142|nr:MFS transporter [Alkalihalobacillus sp. AL-G]WLD94177.1 MFS transporter [Alkalihalobacillus sp. AL-G]
MKNWRRSSRFLWLCNFIIVAAMTMVLPFLPLFLEELGVTNEKNLSIWTGAIFSAAFLSGAIMAPIWGVFADKYGQKANLVRAGIGMGIMTFLMAFATGPWMLLILRFCMGFFSGFITVAFSYLSRITPKEHTGAALGFLQTGGISGGIIGPLIGGALSDIFGFRAVFAVTGVSILMAVLLVVFLIPKDQPLQTTKGKHGTFLDVLRHRELLILFMATFLLQAAMLSTNSMMTIFVKTIVSNPENLAFLSGLAASILGIATIIGSPYLGRLGDRLGHVKMLPAIMLFSGILFFPQLWTDSVYELYAWRFLQGLILGGVWPALQTLIYKKTPETIQGRAFGVTASCRFLGNLIGPIIGGWISGAFLTAYVFGFAGVILIIGSVLVKFGIEET